MSKNWAICIGINRYYRTKPLKYAVNDAVAVRDFFQNEVKFDEVYYFSDNSPDIPTPEGPIKSEPTRNNLRYFFRKRFPQRPLTDGDNVWLFFAGHGRLHEGKDYLMPIDVDPDDIEDTALELSDITGCLRAWGADNIVLLLDACREDGSRGMAGIGTDLQPGIVTFYSCSPRQSSYEIDALQQGAFTHALLEGIRLQGANSRATVQRLDQYLQDEVPKLGKRYQKEIQNPYTAVEPLSKNCLILLPDRARLEDVVALKSNAQGAELDNDLALAEKLWDRVLVASPGDRDARRAIRRIAVKQFQQQSSTPVPVPDTASSRSVTEVAESAPYAESDATPTVKKTAPTFTFETVTVDAKGNITKRAQRQAEYRRQNLGQGVHLDLVMIPGGTFQMGSADGEGDSDERPRHQVTVKPFLIGKYPVTKAQWKAVAALPKVKRDLKPDPARFKGANHPVEQVDWDMATEFCERLSKHTGREYRLPSEAEWEYACRAGTSTPFHFGKTLTSDLANYDANYTYGDGPKGNYRNQTTDVGSFPANAFGLHDMHGNVWEWCLDHWHENYDGAPTDGSAWTKGGYDTKPLLRGGSWYNNPGSCRSALRVRLARDNIFNDVGFRIVSSASWTP
ncbi:MAG: SUMF1/EgtB/PvdO family nonheme iron enzyme [Cyanobacteria bacterium P01_D01_bin.14]